MNNTNSSMGFAGLSKLISNIDQVCIATSSPKKVSPQPQAQLTQATPSANPSSSSNTHNSEKATEAKSPQKSSAAPTQSSSSTTQNVQSSMSSVKAQGGKKGAAKTWFWGFFLVSIIWIAIIAMKDGEDNKYPSPSYSSTSFSNSSSYSNAPSHSHSEEPAPLTTSPESISTYQSSTSPEGTVNSTSEPTYTQPSIGRNNVLSISEIRWCVREKIRIETMKNYVHSNQGINKLNGLIAVYNSRCGSYRYRRGNLSQAQRDVEPFRSAIVKEAIREAGTLDGKLTTPSKTKSSSSKSDLVRQVQQLLTEIGYAPGPVDGSYGRKTKEAIMSFQRHEGLVEDGIVTESLLRSLKKAYEEYPVRYSERAKKTSSTSRNYFTKGSYQSEVILIQGTPQRIYDLYNEEQWNYGSSSVTISKSTKKVLRWSNIGGNLHVKMIPGKNVTTGNYFTKGSHRDDVVRLQGTPQRIYDLYSEEKWSYGASSVTISKSTKKVLRWSNIGGNLNIHQ